MLSKEEIEANELATKIYRVHEYILDEIKRDGEISYFKEDVLYIIHNLLERQLTKEEQTACEIAVKNQESRIIREHEKNMQMRIDQLESDNYELNDRINDYIEERRELIEKLEEDIKSNIPENHKNEKIIIDGQTYHQALKIYAQEILSILKGEKE